MASSAMVLQLEHKRQHSKEHLIELSKIKYGLFNVDEWKVVLAEIVTRKVEELDLQDSDRDEMHARISEFLYKLLDDFEARYYEENSSGFSGFLKTGVASITGTFEQLRKDVPTFTDQIIDFLNDERNRNAIKAYVIDKLNEYADDTFAQTDYSLVDHIVTAHGQDGRQGTISILHSEVDGLHNASRVWKIILLCLALAAAALLVFIRNIRRIEFLLFASLCLVYLLIGVLLPMIEIDARIAEITFTLIGEPIAFTDQVLYYKSKSILQIVHLMLFQNRIDLIAVGILVLTFSVLFPVTKLLSSVGYLYRPQLRDIRFFDFMIFRSGKWSMADVMVVAIFMAYIGFDGIISEQLRQMEEIAITIDMITTNESDLLFGFYAFVVFVLLSLGVAGRLGNLPKRSVVQV